MSSEYIKKIRTEDGDKQIDYESLANLPDLSEYATKEEFDELQDTVNGLKENPSSTGGGETGVEAGTYGGYDSETGVYKIPNVTVDAKGRVTGASMSVLPKASAETGGYLSASDYAKLGNALKKCSSILYINGHLGNNEMMGYFHTGYYNTKGSSDDIIFYASGKYTDDDGVVHVVPLEWRLEETTDSKGYVYTYIYTYLKDVSEIPYQITVTAYSNYELSAFVQM